MRPGPPARGRSPAARRRAGAPARATPSTSAAARRRARPGAPETPSRCARGTTTAGAGCDGRPGAFAATLARVPALATSVFRPPLVSDDGPVARVTLNRPEKRNALSLELMEELTAAPEDRKSGG